MAIFFLLVGLEVKREWFDGQLSTWPRRVLPGSTAVAGMAAPLGRIGIVPLFGFANAGVLFMGWSRLPCRHRFPLGIAAGLFAGK